MVEVRSGDVIEDHIKPDECRQSGKVLETDYSAIVQREHLQVSIPLQLLPNFSGEVATETNRDDVDHIDHVGWRACNLVANGIDKFLCVGVWWRDHSSEDGRSR